MATTAALTPNTPEAVTDTLLASQSKLKNVDAQRILAVLQEAQRKIALMALLPVRMDARLTMVFGEEFSTLVNVCLFQRCTVYHVTMYTAE